MFGGLNEVCHRDNTAVDSSSHPGPLYGSGNTKIPYSTAGCCKGLILDL